MADPNSDSNLVPDPAPGEGLRRCEGFGCRTAVDVRFDRTSKLWLCAPCWSKVDPAAHGFPGR